MELREYLFKSQITHREFGKKLGLSASMTYRLLCGIYEPPVTLALKILEVTKGQVTIQDLVKTIELKKTHTNQ